MVKSWGEEAEEEEGEPALLSDHRTDLLLDLTGAEPGPGGPSAQAEETRFLGVVWGSDRRGEPLEWPNRPLFPVPTREVIDWRADCFWGAGVMSGKVTLADSMALGDSISPGRSGVDGPVSCGDLPGDEGRVGRDLPGEVDEDGGCRALRNLRGSPSIILKFFTICRSKPLAALRALPRLLRALSQQDATQPDNISWL